jgi:hypothetical protein
MIDVVNEVLFITLVRHDALISLLIETGVIEEKVFEEKCENIFALAALEMQEETGTEQEDS